MTSNLEALEAMMRERQEGEARAAAAKADQDKGKKGFQAKRNAQQAAQGGNADRDELMAMCAEVDLLSLIQADTGETGRKSGDRVDFHDCPICHHRDDFSYYTATNSWSCFGGSNENAKEGKPSQGGNVLDYLQYARGMDDPAERVKWLREATGHPFEPKGAGNRGSDGGADDDGGEGGYLLPSWDAVRASNPPKRNPPLIRGIVRLGHMMLITGKGKGSKTWTAVQLGVAVATGGEWFGYKCEQGGVLYCDPELDHKSLDNRFHEVAERMGADAAEIDRRVKKWCLRGVMTTKGEPPTIADLAHDVAARCNRGDFALVVIDSASCFIMGDENASADVRKFFVHVLRIAESTGAAVLVVHHMGKGAKGDWDSIERSRGSSVWGDAPDAPLSLIEVFPPSGEPSDYLAEGERAFVLEDSGLREFPGIEPRHVIFDHPTHRVDADGITDNWKPKSGQQSGGRESSSIRKAKAEADRLRDETLIASYFIRNGIGKDGASVSEIAREVFGQERPDKVKRVVEASETFGLFKPTRNRLNVVPIEPPPEPPEEPPTLDLESG